MSTRGYGQYCGFSRALELVGERWGLLVVRDLFTGPKRFSDLQHGLPKIPSNVLSTRLKELEESRIVERVAQREPRGVFYRLTPDGLELEDAVVALSRWGAKRLGNPRHGEIITQDSMIMAFRTTFRHEHADGPPVKYELHFGDIVLHAAVKNRHVVVGPGPLENPDLIIEGGAAIGAMMAGEVTPKEAIDRGIVEIKGKRALLDRFAMMFRI